METIIDKINSLIMLLLEKFIAMIPPQFYSWKEKLKHLPTLIAHFIKNKLNSLKAYFSKHISNLNQNLSKIKGHLTAFFIYIRSDEFKNKNKFSLFLNCLTYIRNNPLLSSLSFLTILVFGFSFYYIGLNTSKIFSGAKDARHPASIENAGPEIIDNTIFEIRDHHFEVIISAGGGHGGGAAHEEEILKADIKLKLTSEHKKELLEEMEEMVEDILEAVEISTPTLPINETYKKKIEENIVIKLNNGFEHFSHEKPIINAEIIFHQHKRPKYYRKSERSYSLQNVDLQVFEEDLNRNHQVYIDFTVVASNRNVVLFLKDHEFQIRDQLSTNVEPILPHLPIEDEGRRIIKDKIKDELNEILKKEKIEGKIQEVYLDFSMSS